ncbi:uncharacterized protein K02A2.6-like [Rhipicephalus sanguineus]|uniref:uncharacterized protein K02A2.6-like n=1 Tax=Rhipicephalus sanguineus TaxID=34632 RepID=UPI00189509CF|nr:uncharacterized protein K02A2.6-like [Rhipicephalus sanguineus]
MATGGMQAAIEPFSGKNWSSWIQRLTFYFVANDVCDEQKKRALLLTLCGADTFETACALVAPKTPGEVGYADIVALLQKHFDPRPSELYSRCVFQRRDQRPEESISNYVAALRSLSADCNFGVPATTSATSTPPAEGHAAVLANPTMLPQDVMLRDRFVCGIRDEHLQQRLFAEKDLTFQRALDLALSSEREELDTVGSAQVRVRFKSKDYVLPLLVMKGTGCNLLGRDWFSALNIRVHGINQVAEPSQEIQEVLARHPDVFKEGIDGYVGPLVHLDLEEGATPKFCKARPVPLAYQEPMEEELDRLQKQGILEPTQHAEMATPSVWLRGGTTFSTLDLYQAYQQLRVDDETAALLTVNTTKGLFKVNRLPFGVSAAPAIFQRMMETTLAGIQRVSVYLDDIIVSGKDVKEHAQRLEEVLTRLSDKGLRLKREKCRFGISSVKFLGHKIDAQGVHTTEEKVKAILEAPKPTDKTSLQAFLGLLAFYDRFLENRATVAAELYGLLEKNTPWKWEKKHQDAFEMLKKMIRSSTILAHYDEKRPLILSVDASPYGIGAILAQKDAFGREAPIGFASRTLGTAEKNYSQLDKEGLAVVYGVSHFHQYVAGRHVTVLTDHQLLLGIMGEKKQIPQILSPRMTRWCLKLATYDYDLVYRPGRLHQNADTLSRLPLPAQVDEPCSPGDVLMLASAPRFELSPRQLAELTRNDPLLSRVMTAVSNGELRRLPKQEFSAFTKLGHELSLQEGCVIRGARLVVPEKARKDVLDLAHAGHRGVVAMKACARGYFWWPGVDNDIERVVKSCATCCQHQKTPTKAPAPEWKRATTPWHTIHADFAGPVEGRMLLIVVDAYSKWLEVRTMRNIQSPTLIEEMRNLFATFGIPERVRKRRRRMICPQRPTPSIAKLRPSWTLVRRKLAMTNPAGPRSTKVRLGPNVIGVHLTDTVTPSKG